jgi:hypothetical protein
VSAALRMRENRTRPRKLSCSSLTGPGPNHDAIAQPQRPPVLGAPEVAECEASLTLPEVPDRLDCSVATLGTMAARQCWSSLGGGSDPNSEQRVDEDDHA